MVCLFSGTCAQIVREMLSGAGLVCLLLTGPFCASAQTTPVQNAPDSAYTLHVYTDLLQVPTVVLTSLHSNYRSLTKQSFTLTLDNGPQFHPANVRLEGDDPVTLAIIFDLTTDDRSIFESFAQAMMKLPADVLTERNHLSVYAYDCELVRTTEDRPATPQYVQDAMAKVMTDGRDRARNGVKGSCWSKKRLYDAIARVGQDIGDLPGRRVILVISDGADRHSVNEWPAVARFVGNRSVAVFGLRPIGTLSGTEQPLKGSRFNQEWMTTALTDSFGSLCGTTGGLVLDSYGSTRFMEGQIERLMTVLRNRYIIEFPRPSNGDPGYYAIDVKIGDPTAIIRPAGISFPSRSKDPEKPEGTLPTDTSRMPVVGSKSQNAQPR